MPRKSRCSPEGWIPSLGRHPFRADDPRPLLLVMFREIGLLRPAAGVQGRRTARRTTVGDVATDEPDPGGRRLWARLETSSRTRGLLYPAGAIRAAAAHGVALSTSRERSARTQSAPDTCPFGRLLHASVHPRTLGSLNALLAAVGDTESAVRVVNPWHSSRKARYAGPDVMRGSPRPIWSPPEQQYVALFRSVSIAPRFSGKAQPSTFPAEVQKQARCLLRHRLSL